MAPWKQNLMHKLSFLPLAAPFWRDCHSEWTCREDLTKVLCWMPFLLQILLKPVLLLRTFAQYCMLPCSLKVLKPTLHSWTSKSLCCLTDTKEPFWCPWHEHGFSWGKRSWTVVVMSDIVHSSSYPNVLYFPKYFILHSSCVQLQHRKTIVCFFHMVCDSTH